MNFLITDNVSFKNIFMDDLTEIKIDFHNEMLIACTLWKINRRKLIKH